MYATAPRKRVIGWFEVAALVAVDVAAPDPAILAAGGETPEGLAPSFAGLTRGYGIAIGRYGGMREDVRVPGGRGPMSYRIIRAERGEDAALLERLHAAALGLPPYGQGWDERL